MNQPKHGFNPLLRRYLPELFGFEVKTRLLLSSSLLATANTLLSPG
jgi:hypothetical protein